MTAWKYTIEKCSPEQDTVEVLNKKGAEGWELVGVTVDSGGITFLYFKKEVVE